MQNLMWVGIDKLRQEKLKSAYQPSGPSGQSLSWKIYYSIKQLEVFLLPAEGDASPLQDVSY